VEHKHVFKVLGDTSEKEKEKEKEKEVHHAPSKPTSLSSLFARLTTKV
jgi:hypothetical protein